MSGSLYWLEVALKRQRGLGTEGWIGVRSCGVLMAVEESIFQFSREGGPGTVLCSPTTQSELSLKSLIKKWWRLDWSREK